MIKLFRLNKMDLEVVIISKSYEYYYSPTVKYSTFDVISSNEFLKFSRTRCSGVGQLDIDIN